MSYDIENALPAFLDEAYELLSAMESILMDVQDIPPDIEQLNAMFRAMHTIKGSAGLFGLEPIVYFTHEAENLLEALRSNRITFDTKVSNILLRCHDHVKEMLAAVYNKEYLQALASPPLLEEVKDFFRQHVEAQHDSTGASPIPLIQTASAKVTWLLSLRFSSDVLCNGMDPLSFVRYLNTIGEIQAAEAITTQLPASDQFDPEVNYLRLELIFISDAGEKKIDEVFEFIREDSEIYILRIEDADSKFNTIVSNKSTAEIEALKHAWARLGVLASRSTTTPTGQLHLTSETSETSEQAAISSRPGSVVLGKNKPIEKLAKPADVKFIKVEASKLDSLINLIGELVIAGASASLIAQKSGDNAQIESIANIATLIEQIRAGTLSMRMVQIGEIFSRFPRIVHDVSKELNKNIELHVSGAETELDKSMVEKLGDPLMHIVRNAIDHGIENPTQRQESDKSANGNIWLNAYHESGSVVIEVIDDGGGLRKDKILEKGISKGLVSADSALSDSDIYKLIFEPGFSTADTVSNISGRGVGMDVVKRGLEALRGNIDTESIVGEGTHFRIRLPLTLAIIDGFLVKIGHSTLVIPLEAVVECIELSLDLQSDEKVTNLNLRGEVLPVLNLNKFLNLGETPSRRQNVVVVNFGEAKAGLLVDELLGEFQTVIKPLGTLFSHLRAISGSTILGTGDVALILDVPSLINFAIQKEVRQFTRKRLYTG